MIMLTEVRRIVFAGRRMQSTLLRTTRSGNTRPFLCRRVLREHARSDLLLAQGNPARVCLRRALALRTRDVQTPRTSFKLDDTALQE
jgi:hypothetical protein